MLLSGSKIIDNVAQVGIDLIVVSQVLVHLVCFFLKTGDFHASGSNVTLELFDLVVKDKLELLELLGLLFERVDTLLVVTNDSIFVGNLLKLSLNGQLKLLSSILLNIILQLLVLKLSLELVNIITQISKLVVSQLQLSLGSEGHLLNLLLVLSILAHDVILLELGIVHDLSDGLFIVLLLVLDFFAHLLGLSSLTFHHLMMSIHELINRLVMSFDSFRDGFVELTSFLLFLSLKVLELGSIFEHFVGVVISA